MGTRLELLKRYLAEEPDDSFLQYALALEFIALNDQVQAYEQLTKLLFHNPDYLAAYYMAGKSAEALNKNQEAIEWYEKGIEVAHSQKDIHTMNELNSALDALLPGE